MRGACTTTSGSSATVRLPAGRCRKASRWSPEQQHLAVHVEDHPLSYATFEGEIPAGNYGAGTVEVWDHGTYELVEEKANGGLTVRLHGERLDGLWTLVPAHLGGNAKNWLIVKKKEDGGRASGEAPHLRADAGDARGRRADRRGLALRGQVGRLPGDRDDPGRQRRPAQPERQVVRRSLSDGRPDAGARAPDTRLRARRRSRGRRRGRPGDILGDAAGQGRHDIPLRRRSTCSRWRGRR